MANIISALLTSVVRLVRPDVDAIISTFLKAQDKLKAVIERELAALSTEKGMIEALQTLQVERNKVVNRAYRIINNLDEIVA